MTTWATPPPTGWAMCSTRSGGREGKGDHEGNEESGGDGHMRVPCSRTALGARVTAGR
ncbi:hypothetical protein GCM10010365_42340 [Streptomyces poonensis]|uniref:Uncharacterized protein n=1 Tax=Streptomyces poonensis TaxID=68255 RepID=A0A918PP96_9ACTN|nr:hypothetical protein GCM10010365_42340 [Streptomyces poonensis]